jgi:hypothetical protein
VLKNKAISMTNHYQTIKYKFAQFDKTSGANLLVSRYIKYFAECAVVSKKITYSQIITIEKAMKEWEKITNVKFVYEENDPNLFIASTDLNFFDPNSDKEILGAGWEINFKKQQVLFLDHKAAHIDQEKSVWLVLHELGHVPFLLEHIPKQAEFIRNNYDNSIASVMSYNHLKNSYNNVIYPFTPSHYDISLVQNRFGVNNIVTNGDDIYKYYANTIGHYTIFDCGGKDTIDLSEFSNNLNINLNSGSNNINNIGSKFSFSIYESSIIENIITGKGNDVIYGNLANNIINAGAGNNIVYGGGGDDVFLFNKQNIGVTAIKDFVISQDKIKLENFALNCNDFSKIVTINKDQAFIKPDGLVTITLQGDYNLLTCNDMIF